MRNGAFEVLGPLLHVLGQELITRELLHFFTAIPHMSSSVVDVAEVNYHCAFNLPAVLLTIGPQHWDELLPCFLQLTKDTKFPVRRTLACSLHELGHILGPQLTLQHVVPVMDAYLKDSASEVKGGIVKTFACLLRCLPPERREEYVEVLWDIQKQRAEWRWRYMWAKQLPAFNLLFTTDTTASTLIPLTFSLCRDSVSIVRLTAARAVGSLVKRLLTDSSQGLHAAISACKAFANGNTYMERQLFVHMCEGLVELIPPALFIDEFLPVVCALTADPIKNVRIALAAFFSALCAKHPQFGAEREDVRAMMDKLRQDTDRDVRNALIREDERRRSAERERQAAEDAERSRNDESLLEDERMAGSDDGDELDELLGHSTKDREEEAAERAKIIQRRLSASAEDAEKVATMKAQLERDGVKEDRAENELLDPAEEKEIQRLPQQPTWDMQLDALVAPASEAVHNGGGHPPLVIPLHSPGGGGGGKGLGHHPAHVATPRGSPGHHPAPVAMPPPLEAKAGGGGGGGATAPMEVDSPAPSAGGEEEDGGRVGTQAESMATDEGGGGGGEEGEGEVASNGEAYAALRARGKMEAAAANGVDGEHLAAALSAGEHAVQS